MKVLGRDDDESKKEQQHEGVLLAFVDLRLLFYLICPKAQSATQPRHDHRTNPGVDRPNVLNLPRKRGLHALREDSLGSSTCFGCLVHLIFFLDRTIATAGAGRSLENKLLNPLPPTPRLYRAYCPQSNCPRPKLPPPPKAYPRRSNRPHASYAGSCYLSLAYAMLQSFKATGTLAPPPPPQVLGKDDGCRRVRPQEGRRITCRRPRRPRHGPVPCGSVVCRRGHGW